MVILGLSLEGSRTNCDLNHFITLKRIDMRISISCIMNGMLDGSSYNKKLTAYGSRCRNHPDLLFLVLFSKK